MCSLLFFAFALLTIFLWAAVWRATRDEADVPQENMNKYFVKEQRDASNPKEGDESAAIAKLADRDIKLKVPVIDQQTGLCIVCGYKRSDGHAWPCIIYFMKIAVATYDKKFQKVEFILTKLLKDSNLSKEEVEHVLEEIQNARDLINHVGD